MNSLFKLMCLMLVVSCSTQEIDQKNSMASDEKAGIIGKKIREPSSFSYYMCCYEAQGSWKLAGRKYCMDNPYRDLAKGMAQDNCERDSGYETCRFLGCQYHD
jgi:hypothetical protein